MVAAVLTDDALVLAETSTHSLRFYDRRTGALIRAVGRKGEGPGDFGNLDLLQAVGDRLHTFDGWLMRVTAGPWPATWNARCGSGRAGTTTRSMSKGSSPTARCSSPAGCPTGPASRRSWTVYSGRGDIIGRVSAPEPDIVVMVVDYDIAAVLIIDELGVQTVELRRVGGLP